MGSKTKSKTKNKPKPKPENSIFVAAVPPSQKPNNHAGKLISDPRFSSVHTDPRFRDAPKRKSKIQIDSRFSRMFTDKNFASSKTRIDKRGKSKGESENKLKRYYSLDEEEEKNKNRKLKEEIIEDKIDDVSEDDEEEESDGESEEIEDEEEVKKVLNAKNKSGSLEDDEEDDEDEEDDVDEEDEEEEGESEEDSSSTSSSDEEEYVEEEDDTFVQEENIPEIDKETNRLAIVNMDWSQVKAVDLYVLLSSFLPKGGQIKSVAVYPSEFGLQRMEEEAVRGPIGLFDDDSSDKEEDDDDDDNEEINEKKLRKYELSRMRYYYAVVECDTIATADYLYNTCDGVEFERSAVKLDLRFIPDSLELKREPRDVATEPPSSYDGLDFETRVLQQTKVETTWDEDEPQRKKALRRKFNEDQLAELELKEFLASDESGTDDDDGSDKDTADKSTKNKKQDMYRALLQSGDGSGESEDEEGQDMEVTFNTGLEDISKRILEKKDKQSETVWEAYLRKKKEKKKGRKANAKSSDDESDSDQEAAEQPDDFFIEEPSKKVKGALKSVRTAKKKSEIADAEASKAELELLLADDNGADSNPKGYNLKPKKSKGKKGKEVPDESKIPTVDYEDPRFSQLFKSPLFALDPTDPQFKRSAAYARQLVQNQKSGGDTPDDNGDKQAEDPSGKLVCKDELVQSGSLPPPNQKRELSLMVSSLKMKAKQQRASNDVSRLLPAPKKRKKNDE